MMQITSTTMIQRLNIACQSSWSRSVSFSAVARMVVALVVCVNMGLFPQVRGQTNYTVGSGFVNGSLWTNTINGLVQSVILENAYKQWADSVSIKEGDTLSKFLYTSSEHFYLLLEIANYHQHPSQFFNVDWGICHYGYQGGGHFWGLFSLSFGNATNL